MSATLNRLAHTGSGDALVPVLRCVLSASFLFLSACLPHAPQPPGTGAPRLVSTAPNLTECVFAVGAGDLLVGRTESCNYPAEAQRVPAVGGFGTPYLEPLLAAHPSHVLETVLADPDLRRRLEALGVPVVHVPCSHLDEIPDALRQIGGLTGHAPEAERVANALRQGILQARTQAAARAARPRVLLLFCADSPVTSGRRAFVSELLELAGGLNVGSAEDADYYHVSLEWLLQQNPDIILCLFDTAGRDPAALFENQTGWEALSAVRQRRVYTVSDLDTASRPGPRLLEGLAQLKHVLELDAQRKRE